MVASRVDAPGIVIGPTTSLPNCDYRPPDYAHIVSTLMPLDA